MPRPVLLVSALLLGLATAFPAHAHKMKAFATVEGSEVVGYAYFSPGGRVREGTVRVTAPDGRVLATPPLDDQGNFRFSATEPVDHIIRVDGGDGHAATFTVPASELSPLAQNGSAAPSASPPVAATLPAAPVPDLGAVVAVAVAREIRPLREQLDAYQEKVWMHDVLGGLGVIAGLGGAAYGLAERRRRRRSTP